MSRVRYCLVPAVAFLLLLSSLAAQSGKKKLAREEKKDYYHKWLMEDVLYIITPEERAVFSKLQTDEERERFIEQFWRRRDPDPSTAENEYKEEHYRRIAYANDHFTSGFPGWKTDRGMIYIKFGKPDHIESNAGGHYLRPSYEGGGATSVYPFERWEYRYLKGVGQDVEIEFVDDSLTGEYRLTTDPDAKDALLHTPNAGLTDAEILGVVQQKIDRIVKKTSPMPGHNPLLFGVGRAKDQPFEKLRLVGSLERAPLVNLNDLRTVVATRVSYHQLPFQVRSDVFRVAEDRGRVLLTLYARSSDLSYKPAAPNQQAQVDIYGAVRDLGGKVVRELKDSLISRIPQSSYRAEQVEPLIYQHDLFLPPGRYKLELVAKDTVSGKIGSSQVLLLVPKASPGALSMSSIMLARRIETVPVPGSRQSQFRIWPLPDQRVSSREGKLGFYFEVYGFQLDQSSGKPDLEIRCQVVSPDGSEQTPRLEYNSIDLGQEKVNVLMIVSTRGLAAGRYTLKITLADQIGGHRLVRSVPFQLASLKGVSGASRGK